MHPSGQAPKLPQGKTGQTGDLVAAPFPTGPDLGPNPEALARFGKIVLDLGTGDAKWPHRLAKAEPDALVAALDLDAVAMREVAAKIGKKPAKGGVDNLMLFRASAYEPPYWLFGRVDLLTVNYPWGELLAGAARPDPALLVVFRGLLKTGGRLELLLNTQVFDDPARRAALALPELDDVHLEQTLLPAYELAGFGETLRRRLGPGGGPKRTSWGGRLTLGSRRDTLELHFEAR